VTGARGLAAPLAALAVIAATYAAAREPVPSPSFANAVAAAYRFERMPLPDAGPAGWTHPPRSVRPVNAELAGIRSWISAVGAAVTIGDLRNGGLPRDLCYVDTRTDSLIVAPVPGAAAAYAPFVLRPPARRTVDPATVAPMGCVIDDFDEDGLPDILSYYWGRSPVIFHALHRGERLGPSSFAAHELVGDVPRWYTNAVLATNLAGTGHTDIVVGNYFRDGARILDPSASDRCAMQSSMSRGRNGAGLHVFRWTPRGYREETGAFDDAVSGGWTLALSAAPLTPSGLADLYVANDFGPDHLLRNVSTPDAIRFRTLRGVRRIETTRSSVLGADSYKGMGAEFSDLLGRGLFDLFVSNITEPYALEESNFVFLNTGETQAAAAGIAPFVNRAEGLGLARSGWAWDAKIADFDNSGRPVVVQAIGFLNGTVNRWPELQELATGNDEMLCEARDWPHFEPGDALSAGESLKFYAAERRGGRYVDVAPVLRLASDDVGRGIAVADTSGNGLLDFATAHQWGPSYFYRNASPHPGASLEVRVVYAIDPIPGVQVDSRGPLRLRAALGSTVRVTSALGTSITVVDASSGHSGHRDPTVHVGLGEASTPVTAVLGWRTRSGAHHVTLSLAPGRHVVALPPPELNAR
jgi:enediyne biosynthesis protein E4